jgi:trk system potassium uptake protein
LDSRLRALRLVPLAFLAVIAIGAVLLMLPVSRADDTAAFVMPALFTAVSAVCVTGLITVDTATYWTPFGQGVILALIQLGGLGIMTLATMLGLFVSGKLGLRSTVLAQTESKTLNLGDVRGVLRRIVLTVLACEVVTAAVLVARFRAGYDDSWATAVWHGVFHAVSAFNNAGFALYTDNLIPFVADAWICVPISLAVIVGGIGFPVLAELFRRTPVARWTIHTRITVFGTLLLLLAGIGTMLVFEWSNPQTFGPLGTEEKLTAAFTGGVMPRTAGFNTIDYGQVRQETLATNSVLMFIGGGSAGTAGGIKVTTFFLLAFVIWAEVRGEREVSVGTRRVTVGAQRQALSVALLGVAAVAAGTLVLLIGSTARLDAAVFESISAFATVGLSTGITASLPVSGQVALMVLMFVGRVGTITVASALALRKRQPLFQYPEERPIVG